MLKLESVIKYIYSFLLILELNIYRQNSQVSFRKQVNGTVFSQCFEFICRSCASI